MHQIRVASTRHWSAGKSLIRREPIFDSGETNCAYAPEFAFFACQLVQASSNRQNENARVVADVAADPAADLLDALRGDPLGVLNAHPVDDALGDPAGSPGAGSFAAENARKATSAAEAERRRLEEERARSAHRRARMTAEEKQLQNQARHARRQRAKAAGLAGLEDPPNADPARVEGTLGGDDE